MSSCTETEAVFHHIPLVNAPDMLVGTLLVHNGFYPDWSIEHYNRCSFRCPYCSTDSQGKSRPMIAPALVRPTLERELAAARQHPQRPLKPDDAILVCRQTDPYCPEEADYGVTRQVLDVLAAQGQRFKICTKGTLVTRDLDLLEACRSSCTVRMSLPFADDATGLAIDPHAPLPSARFAAIEALHARNIDVIITVSPWMPGLTDVDAILKRRPADTYVEIYPLNLGEFINQRYFTPEGREEAPPKEAAESLHDRMGRMAVQGLHHSAFNKFSRRWSQDEIHRLYIAERNRIGFVKKTAWYYPPGWGDVNSIESLRFLMPNEIRLPRTPSP